MPAAPPAPLIAAHTPIARCSWGPGGNEEVMIASDDAAMNAQLSPETPLGAISISRIAEPPISEGAEGTSAATNAAGAQFPQRGRRASKNPRSDRVGVEDPLQVGRSEAEARLDRLQCHDDDAEIEEDHELGTRRRPAATRTGCQPWFGRELTVVPQRSCRPEFPPALTGPQERCDHHAMHLRRRLALDTVSHSV